MPKTIHLRLSGLSESFMKEMINQGLTEEDVLAQALGIMAEVWKTKAVARIKQEYRSSEVHAVEFYYQIQTPLSHPAGSDPNANTPATARNSFDDTIESSGDWNPKEL